jgi:hypothetical protein
MRMAGEWKQEVETVMRMVGAGGVRDGVVKQRCSEGAKARGRRGSEEEEEAATGWEQMRWCRKDAGSACGAK